MVNLSNKEKQLLLQLIKSCEYYHLNEKQSIGCINNIISKGISRRSYYTYKRKLYSHDVFTRLKESIYSSPLDKSAILLLNDDADLEIRAKSNKLIADQFPDKNLSFILPSVYHDENDNNTKDKLKDTLAKLRKFEETETLSTDRLNSLPKNATIREEFIRCGKVNCNLCPHGPYYYAYFKDKSNSNKSKLRKKYLGSIDPRQQKIIYQI